MNSKALLLIAVGGGIGSVARFLCQKYIYAANPSAFPWGTFAVNVAGCFLIGVFYALAEKGNILTPEWRLLLTTGFCGGFTTFSTFAYENIALMRAGDYLYCTLYAAGSVVLGIAGVWLGALLVKLT
jgi:CrcB protein